MNKYERDDYCYECSGYGDDYSYDEETDELVSNCPNCPFNVWEEEWKENGG